MIVEAPSAFGKHDDSAPGLDSGRGDLVRLECRLPILAVEKNHPRRFRTPAEHRNAAQLVLGNEGAPGKLRRDGENVEPTDVIADVHATAGGDVLFAMENDRHPCPANEGPRPLLRPTFVD